MKTRTRIATIVTAASLALGGSVVAAAPAHAGTGFTEVSGSTLMNCVNNLHSKSAELAKSGKRTTKLMGCSYMWNPFGNDYRGGVHWSTYKVGLS